MPFGDAATTPERVERTLARRSRVPGRHLIEDLLADRRTGACSVLERGSLHRVERPHGLPHGSRQRPSQATGRRTDQDVRYETYGVVVELATTDAVTARVTYGLVFGGQCAPAAWVGQILQRNGWTGEPTRCPLCPAPGAR